MALTDTPWCGQEAQKLYLTSGEFSSTIKTSEDVSAVDTAPTGISYDGTNTPWCGATDDKQYLQSGQFTSTIKTSQSVSAVDLTPSGISWDGTNTPWNGFADKKLYLTSGQFTSTIKTSQSVSVIDTSNRSISYDGTNTPWSGAAAQKLYLQSGQFTSTLKTSQSVSAVDTGIYGISWDGTNTPWNGLTDDKLYLTSGQFTSTIKTSQSVSAVDIVPTGIETNDVNARLGIGNDTTGDVAITLPQLTVQGGSGATADITLPQFTTSFTGHLPADVSITLPQFTVFGDHDHYHGDITLPQLTVVATSDLMATADLTLPQLSLSAIGLQGEVGNAAFGLFTLPMIGLGAGYEGPPPDCVVMNTRNFAVSEYKKYGFNTMTKFNGNYIMANAGGIYEQDESDTDESGFSINANVKSGQIDTYQNSVQRMRNAWLTYKSDGKIRLSTFADEVITRRYILELQDSTKINERRVKFERGIRGRIFDFNIENMNGASLEIESLRITLEPIISKRR